MTTKTESKMNFEEAVAFLQYIVKESAIKGQKHLDMNLVSASEQDQYEQAMMVVQMEVLDGKISRDDVMKKIGLL